MNTKNTNDYLMVGDKKLTADYVFMMGIVSGFLSLPFMRIPVGGYFIPLPIVVFLLYVYVKMAMLAQNRSSIISDVKLPVLLASFLVCSFISLFFAIQIEARNLLEIVFYVCFTFVLTQLVDLTLVQINRLLQLLCIVTTLLSMIGLYYYRAGASPWFQFTPMGSRNVDLYTVLLGFSIGASYYFTKSKVFIVNIIITVFAVIFSFSRGGAMTMVIMSSFVFILSMRVFRLKRTSFAQVVFLFMALALIGGAAAKSTMTGRTHFIERIESAKESKRFLLMKEGLQIMYTHPVTGIGLSNFRQFTKLYSGGEPYRTAHNAYINFGAETGIGGLVAIVLLILYPLHQFLKLYPFIKLMAYERSYVSVYLSGISISFFLLIISFFNAFYIDASYLFWFSYSFCVIILYHLQKLRDISQARPSLE